MIKISIIIPVYNCEQFIEQSVHSVQRQTVKELEIICVDDGSTDSSAERIKKLQREDARILLLSQNNQGSGAARNLGLSHAAGEFIAFLDADDYYLEEDALESMLLACKRHKTSVCGTGVRIERGKVPVLEKGFQALADASRDNDILSYRDFQFDYGYYGFIFARKLIIDHELQFPHYRRFQDPVFLVKAMQAAEKFCFIDKALYVYRAPNVLSRFHTGNVVDLLHGLFDNMQFAAEHNLKKLFWRTVERLEIEYADVVCHNLGPESLSLLLEINSFIRTNTEDGNYMIKPLQTVFGSIHELEEIRRKSLADRLRTCGTIYLYGAGKACVDFLGYLKEQGFLQKVGGILVTSLKDNPAVLQNIPIMEIKEYRVCKDDLIVVTVVGFYQKEVLETLKEKGIDNYKVIGSYGLFTETK